MDNYNVLKIDRLASIRLYLLSIPGILGIIFFVVKPQNTLLYNISLYSFIIGCFIPILKSSIIFNAKKLEITWLFGLPFLFFVTKRIQFKKVALVLRGKGITKSGFYDINSDGIRNTPISTTLYGIWLKLKQEKKLRIICHPESIEKADQICENIANILFFEEKPNAGLDKRQWSRKKGPRPSSS